MTFIVRLIGACTPLYYTEIWDGNGNLHFAWVADKSEAKQFERRREAADISRIMTQDVVVEEVKDVTAIVCIKYLVTRVKELEAEINEYKDAMNSLREDLDYDKVENNAAYKSILKCCEITERELARLENQEVSIYTSYPDLLKGVYGVREEKGGVNAKTEI